MKLFEDNEAEKARVARFYSQEIADLYLGSLSPPETLGDWQHALHEIHLAQEQLTQAMADGIIDEDGLQHMEAHLQALVDRMHELADGGEIAAMVFSNMGNEMMQAGMNAEEGMRGYAASVANIARQNISAFIAEGVAAAVSRGLSSAPFPLNLVLAGMAGGAAAALFNSIVPSFAEGGIVRGETLAVVGEYAGASANPEVISPLDKLETIITNSIEKHFDSQVADVVTGDAVGNILKIPALASGGLVKDETLALVGEYSNASSNPEVIAPLDKLQGILNNSIHNYFGDGGVTQMHGDRHEVVKNVNMTATVSHEGAENSKVDAYHYEGGKTAITGLNEAANNLKNVFGGSTNIVTGFSEAINNTQNIVNKELQQVEHTGNSVQSIANSGLQRIANENNNIQSIVSNGLQQNVEGGSVATTEFVGVEGMGESNLGVEGNLINNVRLPKLASGGLATGATLAWLENMQGWQQTRRLLCR